MLNFVYYPLSFCLRIAHILFGKFLGPTSAISWILSIITLVLLIRVLLFFPSLKQFQTQRLMQKHAEDFKAIRKKHSNDKQAQMLAERELRQKHGISPMAGCLPQVVQLFLFLGLYHVLQSFNKMSTGGFNFGSSSQVTADQARNSSNYYFTIDDVQNFLDARVFGIPLPSYITQPSSQFPAFFHDGQTVADFSRWHIAMVLLPFMIISGLATYMNARFNVNRQTSDIQLPGVGSPKIMNFLMLYVFPLGSVVSGFIMPGCLLIYFMTNNICTFLQTREAHRRLDVVDKKKSAIASDQAVYLKPKPGVKPKR